MNHRRAIVTAALVAGLTASGSTQSAAPARKGLTDVPGVKVGHFTLTERPTGCTVVVLERGAVGGVGVRGGGPGTRETDLLDPVNMVQEVHAVVLSGGSAFGLDSASGVMRYLEERGIGFDTRVSQGANRPGGTAKLRGDAAPPPPRGPRAVTRHPGSTAAASGSEAEREGDGRRRVGAGAAWIRRCSPGARPWRRAVRVWRG